MLFNSNDSSIFSKPNLFYKISKPTLLNDHYGKIDRTYLHVPVPQCSVFLPEKFLINKTQKKKKAVRNLLRFTAPRYFGKE